MKRLEKERGWAWEGSSGEGQGQGNSQWIRPEEQGCLAGCGKTQPSDGDLAEKAVLRACAWAVTPAAAFWSGGRGVFGIWESLSAGT